MGMTIRNLALSKDRAAWNPPATSNLKIASQAGGGRVGMNSVLCFSHFTWLCAALVSPMQFTHCMPSCVPVDAVAGSTLQIYSIKVSIKASAEVAWPLNVYGVITARDSLDRRRNTLFIRPRNYCQIVTKDVRVVLLFFRMPPSYYC
jgi:hypothetical protein